MSNKQRMPHLLREDETSPHMSAVRDRNEAIADLYNKGVSSKLLGNVFGILPPAVVKLARSGGANIRPKGVRTGNGWFPDRDAEMATAYQAGESCVSIGKRYGLTRERVRQIMLRMKIGKTEAYKAARHKELVDRHIKAAP